MNKENKICKNCLNYSRIGYKWGCSYLYDFIISQLDKDLPNYFNINILSNIEPPETFGCNEWKSR